MFSDAQIPVIEDDRKTRTNPLNANFHKKEFQELWNRIHQKAVYAVQFETAELIAKCVHGAGYGTESRSAAIRRQRGEQLTETTYEALKAGEAFRAARDADGQLKSSVHSAVKYDLIGKLAEETTADPRNDRSNPSGASSLTVFDPVPRSIPEDFLPNAARLINEQKATVIVEHLTYSADRRSLRHGHFHRRRSRTGLQPSE